VAVLGQGRGIGERVRSSNDCRAPLNEAGLHGGYKTAALTRPCSRRRTNS
jgi:hypothetical protein